MHLSASVDASLSQEWHMNAVSKSKLLEFCRIRSFVSFRHQKAQCLYLCCPGNRTFLLVDLQNGLLDKLHRAHNYSSTDEHYTTPPRATLAAN